MYVVPLRLYSVPTCRPIIESSAKMYSRVIRSAGVMAAAVGRGVSLRGSAPVVGTDGVLPICVAQATRVATRAPSATVTAWRADDMRNSPWMKA